MDAKQELCQRVARDLPELCQEITLRIRESQPEYELVPLDDHVSHVLEQQRQLVAALEEGRESDDSDLRRAAALGRLRATQGVSVEAVIGAYHVGNRELWRLLDEYAEVERDFLPGLASLMWRSIERVTSEIAAAHSSVSRVRQAQALTLRHRLIELLQRGELEGEAEDVAATLGFDVKGIFVAACLRGQGDARRDATVINELRADRVTFAVGQGSMVVVLAQGMTTAELEVFVRHPLPAHSVGVGLARTGLSGASASILDAGLCLDATSASVRIRRFDDDWLLASILAQRERLEPVLADRREVILANAHLVKTIETFVDAGFSVTETARRLQLHPNSVAYRLDRWKRLTCWDARTFRGLSQSLLATFLK